jgi:hypothetical protein
MRPSARRDTMPYGLHGGFGSSWKNDKLHGAYRREWPVPATNIRFGAPKSGPCSSPIKVQRVALADESGLRPIVDVSPT